MKIEVATLNIAVYSNRKTFQFCQKWLQLAVLEDHAAFKGLPVSVLMATDHELDDFDKNILIKGKNFHRKLTLKWSFFIRIGPL